MKNVLETLYWSTLSQQREAVPVDEQIQTIAENEGLLKNSLSKDEKKLLLRIVDSKNLIIEATAINSFIHGFKLGLQLGHELDEE